MKRRTIRPVRAFDLRRDEWIPGLRVTDPTASALAASLRLDVQRACSACGELCWLSRGDLVKYDRGVRLLCAPCVGDAFIGMRPRPKGRL